MKLRTLIIDDEPIALEKLRNYVEKSPALELAAASRNGFEAMQAVADTDIQLIITDINMPDLSGMDFVKSLSKPPLVIFTTAYPQYAVDSYRLSAVDYLLKPYGFAEFSQAVNKAVEAFAARQPRPDAPSSADPESLFVKVDYRYIRVALADIRFIKGFGEYLQIYLEGRDSPVMTLSSFAAIMERLPDNFLQVHRSYIVNMNRIDQIERNRIVMDADTYIPIGDSYKASFQQYLASHAIGRSQK